MKLSNFVLTKIKGSNALDWEFFASVDVTENTGFLWWKKTKINRLAIRREYAGNWHFVETGKFTPAAQAEELERSYRAKYGWK